MTASGSIISIIATASSGRCRRTSPASSTKSAICQAKPVSSSPTATMRPSSARRRTGRLLRRGASPSCCASPAAPRGGSRRKSIRRSATLLSGRRGCGLRLLVLDQLEDLAGATVARRIVAGGIAGGRVALVRVGAVVEQQLDQRRVAALHGDDQGRLAHLVVLVDLGAQAEQPLRGFEKVDPRCRDQRR